jgi:hypothetical protein
MPLSQRWQSRTARVFAPPTEILLGSKTFGSSILLANENLVQNEISRF